MIESVSPESPEERNSARQTPGEISGLILTPTARLARTLTRRQAEARIGANRTAWLRPAVLPWRAWLRRLLDDYLLESEDDRVLLKPYQAAAVWAGLIGADVILPGSRVTEMARRSWERLHEGRLPSPAKWQPLELNEDNRRFRAWAMDYLVRLERGHWLDEAVWARELPGHIARGRVPLPEKLVLHGFELPLTPLQETILDAIRAAGTEVLRHQTRAGPGVEPVVVSTADAEDELWHAAAWAREKLESGACRVAIVVPDLDVRLQSVDRILRRVLAPQHARLAAGGTAPWHISLGEPLSRWPLAADALRALKLDPAGLDILELGALLRSPFFAGAEAEAAGRPVLDAVMRELPGEKVTLARLRRMVGRTQPAMPFLAARLAEWADRRESAPERLPPGGWARRFTAEHDALGLARGRGLDSREYQVLEAWQGCLEQLAGLDPVTGPVKRAQALDQLSELAASRVFREQNPGVPLEVLGVYEALGDEFDAVWITSMDDGSWPPQARPDPFLPRGLQSGFPEASPQSMLEHAAAVLTGLCRLAPEVVASWPAVREEEVLRPSRLLGQAPRADERRPDPGPWQPRPVPSDNVKNYIEKFLDITAPAHPGGRASGGTRVLANQSACPFKAFAEHRLGADELEHPRAGLSAMDRGRLLHATFEQFWAQLGSSERLREMTDESLEAFFGRCAGMALKEILADNELALSPSARTMEAGRLATRLADWTALELARPPFRVAGTEKWMDLNAGGLILRGKIDRIDELADGDAAVIDYKGGRADPKGWDPGERIEDPQLPLYALQLDPPPTALIFACLRPDRMEWTGLAARDLGIDGVPALPALGTGKFRDVTDWQGLLDDWRRQIEMLAGEFLAGMAAVDPRADTICRYCHLGALCRIAERRAGTGGE